jgi:hypothetical protein
VNAVKQERDARQVRMRSLLEACVLDILDDKPNEGKKHAQSMYDGLVHEIRLWKLRPNSGHNKHTRFVFALCFLGQIPYSAPVRSSTSGSLTLIRHCFRFPQVFSDLQVL